MQTSKQATWRQIGLKYYALKYYYSQIFDFPVRKITVDAGFSCPNIDGTFGNLGCIFCNNYSFSPRRRRSKVNDAQIIDPQINYSSRDHDQILEIHDQILSSAKHYEIREWGSKFIAYFQPSTNTYATASELELLYRAALGEKNVIGLAIGTRPDVLPNEVLDLLERLAGETRLTLELGLQSIHDKTLRFLNRGHDYQTFLDAFRRLKQRKINVNIHLILGLPDESRDDMIDTAREMARLRPHSVKLHNLYVPRGTLLAEMYHDERIRLPTIDQYASYVVDFLERLPPETVIDRIVADGHGAYTIAPSWFRNKNLVLNKIEAEFGRRHSYQGKLYDSKTVLE